MFRAKDEPELGIAAATKQEIEFALMQAEGHGGAAVHVLQEQLALRV